MTDAPMLDTKTPNLGLSAEQLDGAAKILSALLADEHVLYIKLRNYHWNVTGPHFYALHELFEEQYDELAEIIDDTAEIIRQYGAKAPGTLVEFQQHTRLSEEPGVYPPAMEMVRHLVDDHESIIRSLREGIESADDDIDDEALEDFLIQQMRAHMKMAWLLRSHLEGDAS